MAQTVAESSLKPMQQALLKRSVTARDAAYCPYSKFKVGAALEAEEGSIYTGANVENASFSPSICAERVAMGSAVAAGRRRFRRIAVAAEQPAAGDATYVAPCGLCRQFMSEFGDLEVLLVRPSDMAQVQLTSLRHLMPMAFEGIRDEVTKK